MLPKITTENTFEINGTLYRQMDVGMGSLFCKMTADDDVENYTIFCDTTTQRYKEIWMKDFVSIGKFYGLMVVVFKVNQLVCVIRFAVVIIVVFSVSHGFNLNPMS